MIDDMIAIIGDFCQLSAKNGVSQKKQCYDQICSKTISSLSKKRHFSPNIFAKIF
jgi:hypothetical protein